MATVYPQDSCVHSLFEAQAARTPDTTALIFEDAQLTYQELNQRANQVADRLRALGIGPEALVGICMERSFELVIGVLGILKAGGAYVPLDPAVPPSRLALLLEDAQVAILLTQERLVEALPAHAAQIVCLEPMIRAKADENAPDPTSGVAPGNLAYVIYTSGSTGRPKGVLVEHRNLVALLHTCQQRFGFTSDDVMPWIAPPIFDIALFELFNPLLAGGTTRILARRHVLDLPNLIWALEQSTVFHAVPSLMRQIVQMARSREYNRAALDHIRMIFVGGDLVAPTLLRELQETFEQAEIVVLYGPTESTVICTYYIVPRKPHPDQCVIGVPLHNMYIYLCDSQQQSASSRTPGEICVAGTGVARGYLNRPDLTAERFVPNPFGTMNAEDRTMNEPNSAFSFGTMNAEDRTMNEPNSAFSAQRSSFGARLYRTGDLARRRPDDTLEFLGRIDEQVKVRGYRIEPGEIEITLAQHPRVQEAAVIAQDDPSGEKRLIAYLVPQEESVQLWPSIGEYFVYDELIYYGLTHDERRNARYKAVLQQVVCDKVVVDIGTGSDAILARLCAEAGARKVYAIEILPDSYRRAQRLITELGLEKTITLIHGDATEVSLPEPADICVSEIVEAIGGAEGAAVILSQARRLLRRDGICIPERSVTKIAAARLPDELAAEPRFSPLARHYVEQIFAQVGYPFDVRLCIKRFPASNLLSDVQVFEDLDFTTRAEAEFRRRITLRITKTGRMDGFLLWLNLHLGQGEIIDILDEETAWFPAYFPIFEPGVDVAQGDRIEAICSATLCENRINPDYAIRGTLIRGAGERISFEYESAHHRRRYRATPFYRRLFRDEALASKPRNDNQALILELRDFLAARLPGYMLPAIFAPLDAMPHTPNGKIDRGALSAAELSHLRWRDDQADPRTPVEELLAGIWSQLLGLAQIGRDENFFALGGHSLLATRIIAQVRDTFQVDLPPTALFEHTTVAGLATCIEEARRTTPDLVLPPLQPIAHDRPLPLSFPQEQIWFLNQLAPENIAYAFQMTIRLKGALAVPALQQAFTEIVRRHEILRTTFPTIDGRPVQIIHPPRPVRAPIIDLRELPADTRETSAEQFISAALQQPFDVTRLPLVRWTLFRLAENDHLLLQIEHHFVHDGWTLALFLRELKALYEAFSLRRPSPLPDLPIQYADYAVWQRAWLQGAVLDAQIAYWRRTLAGSPPLLDLPLDRPRPKKQSFRGAAPRIDLPMSLYRELRLLSRREGVTLYMILMSAFQTLLYRYTRQTDILVGTGLANRRLREFEGLIGMMVNTIVLRANLSGNPTFQELLRRVRAVALEAYAHQDTPFGKIVEVLQPERALNRNPLFHVMFSFHDAPVPDMEEFAGLSGRLLERHNGSAKTDLNIVVIPRFEQRIGLSPHGEERLTLVWEYSRDLFDSSTIARMLAHFRILLAGIVADPERRLDALPLLTEGERQQLLIEWNDVRIDYPHNQSIHELFADQAKRTPDAIALVFNEALLTYGELDRRTNQLAHYLCRLGVGPEDPVGIYMERSLELVVGCLGTLKAGGVYIPLDPAAPPARLAFMLDDAQAAVLITTSIYDLEEFQDPIVHRTSKIVHLDADWPSIARLPGTSLAAGGDANQLAYVIYTSGSTGRPKGVQISHGSLLNLVFWHRRAFGLTPQDRATQMAAPGFDASVWELWPHLSAGASIHILPEALRADPVALPQWLAMQAITLGWLPTPLVERIIAQPWPARGALRWMLTGGDTLQHAPPPSFPVALVNNYGPTENTVVTTSGLVVPQSEGAPRPSIGRPIDNTQVYLLDQHFQPVPLGVLGELYIGGMSLARGYLGRPDLTAERFTPNPFAQGSGVWGLGSAPEPRSPIPDPRLYRTGDRARYRPDGSIEFFGRLDHQVKLRGYRIELGEIEKALIQQPGVREAAVTALEDASGGRRLAAYVALDAGSSRTQGQLREALKERLPGYMIPSAFMLLPALPRTANDKIDRRALPRPDHARPDLDSLFVAPRSPTEQVLANIWTEVLAIERVGIDDDFFALGGHSLLATQALSRVRSVFPVEIPLYRLFEGPTIAQFAGVIEDQLLAKLEALPEEEAQRLADSLFQPG